LIVKKKHNRYSILGLKALNRAASKVAKDANKNNYKIPYWKNGKIKFEVPEMITEQSVPPDRKG